LLSELAIVNKKRGKNMSPPGPLTILIGLSLVLLMRQILLPTSSLPSDSALFRIHPDVRSAINAHRPVVALESTIISHGMPYPANVEAALSVERIIRDGGALPATIGIINGQLVVGMTPAEIELLGQVGHNATKASRRDLAVLLGKPRDGTSPSCSASLRLTGRRPWQAP
jgi:pseudouridine-5'-phosphate glycosidase